MISELKIIGLKSFLNRELKLNNLTLLAGLNSSGKSSVIQAILMLNKANQNEKSILLNGHGSIQDIRNTYHKEAITIAAFNPDNDKFQIQLDEKEEYKCIRSDSFEFPNVFYISADRFGPITSNPIYTSTHKKSKIGAKGENLFQFISEHENQKLSKLIKHENSEGNTVLYNIRGWLSEISPNVSFDFEIDKLSDSSYSTFNGFRSMNVGFGLSYSLSVIATLLISTLYNNSIVIIENPEAHLHPKGQTAIARLITLCSMAGCQVIIETHSDHIFDGIRIMVKSNPGLNDNIQLHWFELDENKNTEVESPTILEDGRLESWPKGLFDQFEINSSKLF